ncbi:MAG TPA: MmgE/PrpD family protein, partial [Geminicoccaceae bacterium]|nr:MmgE/PrpD family protein [Geminicoccaceae bacterium]
MGAERAVAEVFAAWASRLEPEAIPDAARAVATNALLDLAGLCIAARGTDYVRAALAAWDAEGPCTALGHARGLDAAGAALINGTAAHGEDFDDSFEGTPVHASAVVLPAVLAAVERYGGSGADALRGYVVGTELMCRLALVAPTAIHRAGFHPTAVLGALGAAAAVGATLRLSPQQLTSALGVAGSMASGIIEYLAEGTWTKRLHAGWAAQAGLRAALLGREGFLGPRTVLEG